MKKNIGDELTESMSDLDNAADALAQALKRKKEVKIITKTKIKKVPVKKQIDGHLLVIFPINGSKHNIAAGNTYLDFYEGEIRTNGEVTGYIDTRLSGTDFETINSLFIHTDAELTIRFDNAGEYTTNSDFFISGIPLQTISIRNDTDANISLIASTNPDAKFNEFGGDARRRSKGVNGKIDITTTATKIASSNPNRSFLWIKSNNVTEVYIGLDDTVTKDNGMEISEDGVISFSENELYTGEIWGITEVGTSEIRYIEV